MTKIKSIALLLSFILICSCEKSSTEKKLKVEIDTYLKEQIQMQQIPGLALGVIKNGNIVYEGYFGKADLENNTHVNKNTLFPVYSITKLIVSTGIFQLVEQNKISLEDTISKYIENTPKNWQHIKIKNLLTHSSGLPDFGIAGGEISDADIWLRITNEKMHYETGNQFEYNQTNYWFLAKIIEKVSGVSFDKFIIDNQFNKDTNNILFSSDLGYNFLNRASRHEFNNKKEKYDISKIYGGKRFHAVNGMNITLRELIKWNSRLDNGSLLGNEQKQNMWKPFQFNNKKDDFLHGWHTYSFDNNNNSYGFTGGGHTGFRKFLKNDLTIIVFTNGHKYFSTHNDIINRVAGIVDEKLIIKKGVVQHEILSAFLTKNTEEAIERYYVVRNKNPENNVEIKERPW